MEFLKVFFLCMILPGVISLLFVLGDIALNLLSHCCKRYREWADREIALIEAWQEDDEL